MNYASLDQDVYAGYGAANRERLMKIKDAYDPEDVFGRLWRGYFKL
jgi:Berberine and berberine like